MKILLISDVHGRIDKLDECLKKEIENVDAVIFTGDGIKDVEDFSFVYSSVPFYMVKGNCDFFSNYPYEKTIDLNGHRLFITHGHQYSVKSTLGLLINKAKEDDIDIVLYGHTHIMNFENVEGINIINSGSLSSERSNGGYTYLLLTLTNEITVKQCSL